MHLIAEDMENLHIHGAPRQTEKAKEPEQKPIPPYSLYFEEALAGIGSGLRLRFASPAAGGRPTMPTWMLARPATVRVSLPSDPLRRPAF